MAFALYRRPFGDGTFYALANKKGSRRLEGKKRYKGWEYVGESDLDTLGDAEAEQLGRRGYIQFWAAELPQLSLTEAGILAALDTMGTPK